MSASLAEQLAEASSKEIGELIEQAVADRLPDLALVDDGAAEWHDGRVLDDWIPNHRLPMHELVLVRAGTPVEIKAAAFETSNGARNAAGRFFIQRRCHHQLVEADGVYLLVVYDPEAPDPLLRMGLLAAEELGERISTWSHVPDVTRSEGRTAKLGWPHVFDRETVHRGGGEG